MHIITIRNGRLGDMVMLLPALQYLRNLHPQAKLTCITSADGARLLKNLPELNIQTIIFKKFCKFYVLKKQINKLSGDLLYCFETNKKYHNALPKTAKRLTPLVSDQIIHYSERCLRLIDNNIDLGTIKVNPSINFSKAPRLHKVCLGIHITYSGWQSLNRKAQHKHRMWPLEHILELVILLKKTEQNIEIIINLLPTEYNILLPKLSNLIQNGVKVLCPAPSFQTYLQYLKNLDLFITPNTGVMHLAAALHTPIIALFSDTDPKDCGPWMPEHMCRLLAAHNLDLGLAEITAKQVFAKVQEIL